MLTNCFELSQKSRKNYRYQKVTLFSFTSSFARYATASVSDQKFVQNSQVSHQNFFVLFAAIEKRAENIAYFASRPGPPAFKVQGLFPSHSTHKGAHHHVVKAATALLFLTNFCLIPFLSTCKVMYIRKALKIPPRSKYERMADSLFPFHTNERNKDT